jgi:hypothetical protein
MAALATQTLVNAGTAPTLGAKALSDTAEVGSGHNTFLVVRNSNAEAKVITVVVPGNTSYGVASPDPTYALADGSVTPTERWIPLRKEYADPAVAGVGRCTVTISTGTATGVTAAVVRVG